MVENGGMENVERVIFNYGFNLFFITISLISAVAIMTFFKKEKRTVGNVFRFLVFIVFFNLCTYFLRNRAKNLENSLTR